MSAIIHMLAEGAEFPTYDVQVKGDFRSASGAHRLRAVKIGDLLFLTGFIVSNGGTSSYYRAICTIPGMPKIVRKASSIELPGLVMGFRTLSVQPRSSSRDEGTFTIDLDRTEGYGAFSFIEGEYYCCTGLIVNLAGYP